MPTILSVPDIIEIGRASTYLSANYTEKKKLFGGSIIKPVPPVQIAWVTDALDWGYLGGAQTAASLRSTANYALWIYGLFQLQAQAIIYGPGGGSVIPTPSGGAIPNPLDFEVTDSSFMVTGQTTVNIPQFIGYNVNFSRGGIMQNTTSLGDGSSYYSWNIVTGDFTIFGEATEGELFRIMPDTGAGGAVVDDTIFPFLVVSADFEVDGVTIIDSRFSGNTVTLFPNNFAGNLLIQGTDFTISGSTLTVTNPAFNANDFNYTIQVNKIN